MAEKPASPIAASVDRPAARSRRARAAKKAHTAALPRPAARGDVSPHFRKFNSNAFLSNLINSKNIHLRNL